MSRILFDMMKICLKIVCIEKFGRCDEDLFDILGRVKYEGKIVMNCTEFWFALDPRGGLFGACASVCASLMELLVWRLVWSDLLGCVKEDYLSIRFQRIMDMFEKEFHRCRMFQQLQTSMFLSTTLA